MSQLFKDLKVPAKRIIRILWSKPTHNEGVFYTLPCIGVNTPTFVSPRVIQNFTPLASSPDNLSPNSSQGVLNVAFTVLSWSNSMTRHDTRDTFILTPDLRPELDILQLSSARKKTEHLVWCLVRHSTGVSIVRSLKFSLSILLFVSGMDTGRVEIS